MNWSKRDAQLAVVKKKKKDCKSSRAHILTQSNTNSIIPHNVVSPLLDLHRIMSN